MAHPEKILENRRFVLNRRPQGEPDEQTFRLETGPVPVPGEGEFLVRNHYLSLDPYMRGRLSDRKSYAAPVGIGETMVGGTVGRVVSSRHPDHAEGDWVVTVGGWQDYAISNGALTFPLAADMPNKSWALGVLGMPGFTAWAGLTQIGQPKAGETLVVAAATGPVGAMVGQLAKHCGLRVVGVAGGPEKCRHAVEVQGFDACIDHRAADFAQKLAQAVPEGIDIYFENVGGKVFDAVMPLLNSGARIPLCGTVATYNSPDLADEGRADRTGLVMARFLQQRIVLRGFIVFDDFGHLYPDFMREVAPLVAAGRIVYTEDMTDGLENAPRALNQVLRGENFGKKVIRIAAED
ncbi:NADP-dependent oxidoreductase [Paracoccus marinaquae]|uniref:NADP-dependent oxidoreductase n=1 Tax=Paracoccus marinaquae TaxID=2841926 RepID=A0ABS6AKE1_9RHOB|nr:NADP-dependent oxidoreductase [Paracoccus marinaquae]MBU3029871.1 NADP-dependent oxidoreductase [Paracoccus marinaquae]